MTNEVTANLSSRCGKGAHRIEIRDNSHNTMWAAMKLLLQRRFLIDEGLLQTDEVTLLIAAMTLLIAAAALPIIRVTLLIVRVTLLIPQ